MINLLGVNGVRIGVAKEKKKSIVNKKMHAIKELTS